MVVSVDILNSAIPNFTVWSVMSARADDFDNDGTVLHKSITRIAAGLVPLATNNKPVSDRRSSPRHIHQIHNNIDVDVALARRQQ
jgi:hypothetical protein